MWNNLGLFQVDCVYFFAGKFHLKRTKSVLFKEQKLIWSFQVIGNTEPNCRETKFSSRGVRINQLYIQQVVVTLLLPFYWTYCSVTESDRGISNFLFMFLFSIYKTDISLKVEYLKLHQFFKKLFIIRDWNHFLGICYLYMLYTFRD